MKKIFYTIIVTASVFMHHFAIAQACTDFSLCTPAIAPSIPGFEASDSLPCVTQQENYDDAIQFRMYALFPFGTDQVPVDSIEFKSISNLPCGLCWSTSHANNRFSANETGCISIKGTTGAPAGQYKLAIELKAWTYGLPNYTAVNAALVDQSGIRLYVRVNDGVSICAPVDTNSTHTVNLTANCSTGIGELTASLLNLAIAPNPMAGTATVSFVAEKKETCTMQVTDISGRLISSKEINALPGYNSTALNRNLMPAGMYFLTLVNGQSSVTAKLSVVE